MRVLLRLVWCLAVSALLPGTAAAQSSPAEVRDTAGLFNPELVARLDEQIKTMQRIYHRDLLVETIKEIPKEELALLKKDGKAARAFAAWARQLAEQHNVNGVYVLISADPRFKGICVTPWPEENKSVLGPHATLSSNELRWEFMDREKRSGPNLALKELVERVESLFGANLTDEGAAASPLSWISIGLIILAVLVLWLFAVQLRKRLARKQETGEASPASGQQKALPGMLGGMFGTMAGHWLYDDALKREAPAAVPPAQTPSVSQTGFPLQLQPDQTAQKPADDLPGDEAAHQADHDSTQDR